MRTVSNLLSLNGRIYVYLPGENLSTLFRKNAEAEGFTFTGERQPSDVVCVNPDRTIHDAGWAGHMAFRNPKAVVGAPLIRVDYGKYLAGREDYVF